MKKEKRSSVSTMESSSHLINHYALETQKLEVSYARLQHKFHELKTTLEETLETLQQVINHLSEGMIFIEKNGTIALLNPAAAALTGHPSQAARGKKYWELFPDHFFGFSMAEELLQLKTRRHLFLTLEGDIDVEVSASAIPNKGIALLIFNRTEQQKMQKSLSQAERLKELGEMAATLAHEIRNPLGGVEGFALLLKRDLKDSNHQEMIEAMLQGTQAINHLVTNMLDYARPLRLHFAPADLIEVVKEAISLIQASDPKLKCQFKADRETWSVSIDKVSVKLVLLNLLKNGSEAGAKQIDVELAEGILYVCDDGSGISSKHIDKIFTPLFTTKNKGNGLGLAQSWAVIQAHGGTLEVASQQGEGTQFKLKI